MSRVNFAKLPTEQLNRRTARMDRASITEILSLINTEDRTVATSVAKVRPQISCGVKLMVEAIRSGGRIFFIGAGTSGRLGVLEAAECPPTFGTPPSLVQAIMAGGRSAVFRSKEGAEDNAAAGAQAVRRRVQKEDCAIGIAASGVTPFVKGALQAATKKGAKTILVTCNPQKSVKMPCDCMIAPKVGPEVIAGSTRLKAGTATKLVLNMLTVATMTKVGKVYKNWMVDLKPKSKKLKARAVRLIGLLGEVSPKKAEQYFLRSKKNVKIAVLMAKKGIDYGQASKSLKRSGGFLGKALDEKAKS